MKFFSSAAFLILLGQGALGSVIAERQSGCAASAPGFASQNGGTKGGAGGTTVTVTNQADLEKYATASTPHVIKVQGKITVTPLGKEIKIANDKTIIGIGASGEISGGGFRLDHTKNIIIRNLRIGNSNDGSGDKGSDFDGIQADGASNIWIDHCFFTNTNDGLIDLRGDTTFFTVSNNVLKSHNKAFGIGWTENVVARGTINHNWFDTTNQRNPSADNLAQVHLYNNYVLGVTSYGHYVRGGTNALIENVYFEKTKNPVTKDDGAVLLARGNTYNGCTGTIASNSGSVFTPPYSYSLTATSSVPSYVRANAGPLSSVCS